MKGAYLGGNCSGGGKCGEGEWGGKGVWGWGKVGTGRMLGGKGGFRV